MFCSKCGKQLNDGAAFCDGCGAAVNKPSENELSGVQRAKAELGKKTLAEHAEKTRAIVITSILSAAELIFLLVAMSSELSSLKFFFYDGKGEYFLKYAWDKQGGVTKVIGIVLMLASIMDVIICYIHCRKRTLNAYKKVLLIEKITFAIVAIFACVLMVEFLDISGWLMVIILIVFNFLSLISVFKAAECENEAHYFEKGEKSKGRFYEKLASPDDNGDSKANFWQCKSCGTLNPPLQNFCKDCGKYR